MWLLSNGKAGTIRKSLLGDGEQMWRLGRPLLSSIDLNHARHIKRVHPRKGIRRNKNDTAVGVDFFVIIS
jgi:hypothetical protein